MNSKAIIGFEGDEFYSRNAAELGLAGKTFQVRGEKTMALLEE